MTSFFFFLLISVSCIFFLLLLPRSISPLPNQQRALSKLPPELRCRDFVGKLRLSIQIGAKRVKKSVQSIACAFQLTFPFCTPPLVVGLENSSMEWHLFSSLFFCPCCILRTPQIPWLSTQLCANEQERERGRTHNCSFPTFFYYLKLASSIATYR